MTYTPTLNPEILAENTEPDPAQQLLKQMAAMVAENFILPAVVGGDRRMRIQPWTLERVLVKVTPSPGDSGDLYVEFHRQTRREDRHAPRGYTTWESQPESFLDTWAWKDKDLEELMGITHEEDLRSYLTAWLTRAGMTHLLR